jgi:two-component system OmpR family sensor kinase
VSDRPTLQFRLVRDVGLVVVAATAVVVAASAFLLHRTIHEQTDAMLVALAETEAHGAISEYEDGIHVHDTGVSLPSLTGDRAEKFSVAINEDCDVVAATSNVTGEVSDDVCRARGEVLDVEGLAETPLRMARWPGTTPDGETFTFLTGVRHERIDRAVTMTILLYGLLSLLLCGAILAVVAWLARRLSADLAQLSEACDALGPEPAWVAPGAFDVSADAPHEIANLGATIEALLARWSEVADLQAEFYAVASHELRTPLTAMKGDIEVTLRRERSAEEYREALERILQDVDRLTDLSSRLLESARTRTEAIATQKLELEPLLLEAVERSRALLESAGIEVRIADTAEHATADPTALSRILDNLIGNTAEHAGATTLEIWCARRAGRVEIHMRDDGRGVPSEVARDLLAPLRPSSDDAHRGLGVYISARLAERLGGSLELRAEPGAHWVVTLPS